ncbi:alkylated DNA repair protein alkB homolog 8 isoform X4 [Anabrus simplex]|uniref:alkylated DNA repair protein alkB homolog 8 isoform X4 n=1 Tax=Anabrus simplex TaxID=316456 RepID=UPI0035A2BD72
MCDCIKNIKMSGYSARKVDRKQRKSANILRRETGINCSNEPTKNLMIGNAGLVTGLQQEQLLDLCLPYGIIENIVMISGKSYCFVVFQDDSSASKAYRALHGKSGLLPEIPGPLYLAYTEKVPTAKNIWNDDTRPSGLTIVENFVSELEEEMLLNCVIWNDGETHSGIPPHVDTHSAFEDAILSLSLGSSVVMDFRHKDGRHIPVLLPRRSLLVMSGEARYSWSHGITPRKLDVVPTLKGGLTVQKRGIRTSFTFRWVRRGECNCDFHAECDSYQKQSAGETNLESEELAAKLEAFHVHKVYEEIAVHFSDTRHKPWPNVLAFVLDLTPGSVLVDVGCGNGKYFGHRSDIFEIGCDRSSNLAVVCKERGFQIFNCNCLSVPLRDGIADGCISIAVIHHLSTKDRRLRAIEEIVRILVPGGKALIYVWAKDQERHKKKSSYLKQDRKNRRGNEDSAVYVHDTPREGILQSENVNSTLCDSSIVNQSSTSNGNVQIQCDISDTDHARTKTEFPKLPLHTNRTQFQHQDVLVPWKLKHGKVSSGQREDEVPTFYRYYHVFEEGELEQLCTLLTDINIVKSYYDQGNWCIILQKIHKTN